MSAVSTEQESSRAEAYVKSKSWNYKAASDGQITLQYCPVCGKDNFHFYMAIGGKKDGLWDCKVGGHSGNLYTLMEGQGDKMSGVESMSDWGSADKKLEPIPNVEAAHRALLADTEALDYLLADRGLTMDVITEQKLGVVTHKFHKQGETKAIMIPYVHNGQTVYAKYRTVTTDPTKKEFDSPRGWQAPLYNQAVIKSGMEYLIFVEGEMNALTLMSMGVKNVVAVPGANTQKTMWVTLVDAAEPKQLYLLFDRDKVGQRAAQEMAVKLGIEKCLNIVLPEFDHPTEEDKKGKDINEWFRSGNTKEDFDVLMKEGRKFDVVGVANVSSALDELEQELAGVEVLLPTYDTPWPALNRKLGGAEPGDVVDVIAEAKIGKTTFALNWIDYIVGKYNVNGLVYCLEMTQKRMCRKWVSMVTETDDSPAVDMADAKLRADLLKAAIPKARDIITNRQGDLLFAYTPVKDADEVFDTIRQAIRRYNLKWVVFDNLQLLCDLTLKNAANRTIHLSQLSKKFKALATEMNVVIVRIIQPNRVREGDVVSARNADGSSQIEKDCDATIALHRNQKAKVKAEDFEKAGFLDEEMAFEPQLLTRVGLSRYAPGGVTTLWFNGGTSTVREFDEAEMMKTLASAANHHTLNANEVPTEA
jgi:replicative DNA helicase/5S rRNA maturation endonuclease (ribonuclease M5)